jgi:hypothetical protein
MQHRTNLIHNEVTYFEKNEFSFSCQQKDNACNLFRVNVLLLLVGLSLQVIHLFSNTTIMWGQQMQMFYLLYM